MPLTNAQRQRAHRERHLGDDGEKRRVLLFLSVHAKARLDPAGASEALYQ